MEDIPPFCPIPMPIPPAIIPLLGPDMELGGIEFIELIGPIPFGGPIDPGPIELGPMEPGPMPPGPIPIGIIAGLFKFGLLKVPIDIILFWT